MRILFKINNVLPMLFLESQHFEALLREFKFPLLSISENSTLSSLLSVIKCVINPSTLVDCIKSGKFKYLVQCLKNRF